MFRSSLRSCIILICFITLLRASPVTNANQQHDNLSADKIRQMKTEEILKYMNTSMEACENFVEFSCGNYGKYYEEFVDNYKIWNAVHDASQMMHSKIIKELNATDVADSDTDRKVKKFYKSCLNRPATPDSSDKLKKLVQEFGQMPILEGENWRENDFDWAHVVADITYKTDIGIIVYAKMTPGFSDNSINRATLLQPNFLLPIKMYSLDVGHISVRSNFEEDITYKLMGHLNVEEQRAQQTAKDIMDFEVALARGVQDLDITNPNILYNVTTIDEAQTKYLPGWDTKKFFGTALDLYPSLVMTQPTYLQNALEVIQKTPKKIVANYIFYKYLNPYMESLSEDESCFHLTRVYFNEYLENMIYRKYLTEQDKSYVLFLWQEMKSAFRDILSSNKLNWIHGDTRQLAWEKLKAMQLKITNHEEINFDKRYAKLQLNDHNIIDNIYAILIQHGQEGRAKVNQPPVFRAPPPDMPAYAPEENTVYFPVAILQSNSLWSSSYPYAINFGSIGSLIAHEMAHGFDDFGRNFDDRGNFKNWWDKESALHFEEHTACLANQYKNYTFKGVNLPDLEIQAENIADNAAIRIAYNAYMKWYNKASITSRQNESLQGIKYNHKQLFFISFAQVLGGATAEEYTYNNDIHPPDELRITGSLSNLAEFAKAFHCHLGSVMNPVKKCVIY